MKVTSTPLKDLYIIETDFFKDHRGWFSETWSQEKFKEAGLDFDFIQDNQSFSLKKGTLRGIHFQYGKFAQTKLVRCVQGKVLDVAVDLRSVSETYKKWFSVELSAENKKQLLIPRGFGHAFLTLSDDVQFLYKVDNLYNQAYEDSIAWNDGNLNINWPIEKPILSEKDFLAPKFDPDKIYFE